MRQWIDNNLDVIVDNAMASVAKWLRQWIVVPPLAGSSPVVRPDITVAATSIYGTEGFSHRLKGKG